MERLSAQDLITLWPEQRGWPQDVGALAVLDGDGWLDADGELLLESARAAIESRLHLVPRFRQVLYAPAPGLGRPLWVDAPTLDIADHVRALRVAAPGDEAAVLAAVERLGRPALPRDAPLWRMWFLTGLAERRIGLYIRVHHGLADGPAAVAMLGAFLDPATDAAREPGAPWAPTPAPSARALLADTWQRRWQWLTTRTWPARRGPRSRLEWRSPRTSLNRVIGSERRLRLVRADLQQIRQLAHTRGATVNDVLLAAVSGGLRDLLLGRGEAVEGLVLRAIVPASLRADPAGRPQGNLLGSLVVPLPVGVADVTTRLRLIAADTAERKLRTRPRRSPVIRSRRIQRAALRMLARQRAYNTYVADVHGPPQPLWFGGARLVEVFPVVALMGNLTVGVGALSYAGRLNVTVVADRASCPDVDVFTSGLRDALRGLGAPVEPGPA